MHASGPVDQALGAVGSAAAQTGGGFLIEPDAMPVVRTAFADAIEELRLARGCALDMGYMAGGGVNPVLDRYMAATVLRATGNAGSVVTAVDSAIVEYQGIIDQPDHVMSTYNENEDQTKKGFQQG